MKNRFNNVKNLYDKIDSLLLQKCIDCYEYYCNTDIKITLGKYLLCNTYSEYYLINDKNTEKMIILNLILNDKLLNECFLIKIYHNKFIIGNIIIKKNIFICVN
jgi:hypothetical protein